MRGEREILGQLFGRAKRSALSCEEVLRLPAKDREAVLDQLLAVASGWAEAVDLVRRLSRDAEALDSVQDRPAIGPLPPPPLPPMEQARGHASAIRGQAEGLRDRHATSDDQVLRAIQEANKALQEASRVLRSAREDGVSEMGRRAGELLQLVLAAERAGDEKVLGLQQKVLKAVLQRHGGDRSALAREEGQLLEALGVTVVINVQQYPSAFDPPGVSDRGVVPALLAGDTVLLRGVCPHVPKRPKPVDAERGAPS